MSILVRHKKILQYVVISLKFADHYRHSYFHGIEGHKNTLKISALSYLYCHFNPALNFSVFGFIQCGAC